MDKDVGFYLDVGFYFIILYIGTILISLWFVEKNLPPENIAKQICESHGFVLKNYETDYKKRNFENIVCVNETKQRLIDDLVYVIGNE